MVGKKFKKTWLSNKMALKSKTLIVGTSHQPVAMNNYYFFIRKLVQFVHLDSL